MTAIPRLRPGLSFVEHVYRQEKSFVVKDPAAQRYFRFGAAEVRVMRAFDGRRTLDDVAALLTEAGLELTTRAIEQFARTLAAAGLLQHTVAERSTLELERLRAARRAKGGRRWFRGEWLRMRWSLGDPDAWLGRTLPLMRWMFTPAFLAASVVLFGIYFVMLGQHWHEYATALHASYSLQTITLGHAGVFVVTALAVILIHELGHGFACKYFGGEVHELGFMILYGQPAFYCNVSDAWRFPERRARRSGKRHASLTLQ